MNLTNPRVRSPIGGFTDNPEPRCPCVLLLDTSASMAGKAMEQLNAGLSAFKDTLTQDRLASLRVEVAVITFGAQATLVQDFITADQYIPVPLKAAGDTPMGAAIHICLFYTSDAAAQ